MTHPPAGPNTPPSSPGPGRTFQYVRAADARAKASAEPLSMEARLDRYFAQNGSQRVTPRQNRRAMHKERRRLSRPAIA